MPPWQRLNLRWLGFSYLAFRLLRPNVPRPGNCYSMAIS
jgi:hypothetical protein